MLLSAVIYRSARALPSPSAPRSSASTLARVSTATRIVMDSESDNLVPLMIISASSCIGIPAPPLAARFPSGGQRLILWSAGDDQPLLSYLNETLMRDR